MVEKLFRLDHLFQDRAFQLLRSRTCVDEESFLRRLQETFIQDLIHKNLVRPFHVFLGREMDTLVIKGCFEWGLTPTTLSVRIPYKNFLYELDQSRSVPWTEELPHG